MICEKGALQNTPPTKQHLSKSIIENQKFRRFSSFSAKIKNLAEHKSAYLFKFLELEPEIEIWFIPDMGAYFPKRARAGMHPH